jgi:hypothetical protein
LAGTPAEAFDGDGEITVVIEDDGETVRRPERISISWDVRNTAGVYLLKFPDGRIYVGSSLRVRSRLVEHCGRMWSGGHRNPKLQRGWSRFKTVEARPLLYCRPSDLLFYEQLCLDRFAPDLNLSFIAGAVSWTQESRDKVSRARKGFRHTEDAKARISATQKGRKGRKHSEEEKERRNSKMRGVKRRPLTPEEKAAVSAGLRRYNARKRGESPHVT